MTVQMTATEQILRARQRGGFTTLENAGLIRLTGEDTETYLQGRTSNDVKALANGQGQLTCLLHRKGHVLALFSLHRAGDRFFIVTEKSQVSFILDQLETYKFREKVHIEDVTSQYLLTALQGPYSDVLLRKLGWQNLPEIEYGVCGRPDSEAFIFKKSITGDTGYVMALPQPAADGEREVETEALAFDLVKLDAATLEVLRIEAGIPAFGLEVTSDYLLPETALEQLTASYSKGCFQGQEVLARIKTYGAPRQALVGLIIHSPGLSPVSIDTHFLINGQDAGVIKSNAYSPTLDRFIALAYIAREYRIPDVDVSIVIEGTTDLLPAKVVFLPLYKPESSKQQAKTLYQQALAEFAHGSELKAIDMLRQAVDADPHFFDAYESLGVILSRQNQLDEAIALMHRLAELDPQSIMAHANLSLYYMQLDEIEKAEEEKAIAMSIRMSKIAKEVVAQRQEADERKKRAEEAHQRIEMFGQVLEIDRDDLLANYGMGSALVDVGKADEGIPFLRKAIAVKPSHTVAWLALGRAYEELQQFDEALKTYEQGVVTAAKRGDITPMNEMKGRLEELRRRLATPSN